MANTLPPAGFYPDPHDPSKQRWWNGTAWSRSSVASGGPSSAASSASTPAPDPAPAPAAPASPPVTASSAPRTRRSSRARARTTWIVASAAVVAVLIGAASIASLSRPASTRDSRALEATTATPTPPPTPTSTPTPTPVVVVQRVDVSEPVAFVRSTYDDANSDVGTTTVVTAGVPGTKVSTWEITTVDGAETGRVLASEVITVAPVDEVIAIGIRQPVLPEAAPPASDGCDPNYAGACVPIASDVDCEGGGGNGPAYVAGPVQVIGADIYDLDRDGDGIACD